MSKAKTGRINVRVVPNEWMFIANEDLIEGQPIIVNLRHPRTNSKASFAYLEKSKSIHEILTFSEPCRSWFIDYSVKSSGEVHITTQIDPLFLIIPYLKDVGSENAIPLEHILEDNTFPDVSLLQGVEGVADDLSLVGDKKGDEELNAFKYNESKVLDWLEKKVDQVAEALKVKQINVSGGAVSANFVKSAKLENSEDYKRYAHGIVSEYISEELSKKLSQQLNLPEECPILIVPKRKSLNEINVDAKKNKLSKSPIEEKTAEKLSVIQGSSTPKQNAKEKARAKAAGSSRTISSFFTPK